MNELINELINHEAVYRTGPATPGLLTRGPYHQKEYNSLVKRMNSEISSTDPF